MVVLYQILYCLVSGEAYDKITIQSFLHRCSASSGSLNPLLPCQLFSNLNRPRRCSHLACIQLQQTFSIINFCIAFFKSNKTIFLEISTPEVFYLQVLGTRMTIESKSPPEVEPASFRL